MTPPSASVPPMSPSPPSGEALKRAAAARALGFVRDGMRLGLGTGSTMAHFVDLLGEALRDGVLHDVVGVPTSERTAAQARSLDIPLQELHQAQPLDLAVDGADEVDPGLDLIKGLGGALLREKMVVQAADRFVVIVDAGKLVDRLGSLAPVPVEVVRFAWQAHVPLFEELGARPRLRDGDDGEPYVTDNANYVVDLHFDDGIIDPHALEARLAGRAGIVGTGLFLGMADQVVSASKDGITVLEREGRR